MIKFAADGHFYKVLPIECLPPHALSSFQLVVDTKLMATLLA